MVYEKLAKLFYKLNKDDYKKELDKRKYSYGSYLVPLTIKGFKNGSITGEVFELFYVNTNELMKLNNEVLLNSSKISLLIKQLPEFIIEPYFHKLIINEAQSNNEIEGIRSTKRELKEALNELKKDNPKYKRFVGLMKTYDHIDEIKPFDKVQDFRSLYDNLVADEIDTENIPDGELFRKEYVQVHNGSVTTHIGISTEEKIVESLSYLINYSHNQSHPELYRYMVAHYYYEYIHPFYDGNGRTGRLITASYLSRYLEKYTSITFSYAVNKNKMKYYKALEEIASPVNRGELTFYLISMLELLSNGQTAIIDDLELNLMKLERIEEYFKNNWKDHEVEGTLLKLIVIINVFIEDGVALTIQDLMDLTQKSRYMIGKSMDNLVRAKYVHVASKRPKLYKVCNQCLEDILT